MDSINLEILKQSIEARIQTDRISVTRFEGEERNYYVYSASLTFYGQYFSVAHDSEEVARKNLVENVLEWCESKIEHLRYEKQKRDDEQLLMKYV